MPTTQKVDPKQAPSSKDFKNWDGSRAAICNSNITGRAVMPTAFKPPRKRLFQLPWRSLSLAPLPLWPHYLKETRSIPIVFSYVVDPVGSGFVQSFARPGGNVTGFQTYEFTIAGKWLQ